MSTQSSANSGFGTGHTMYIGKEMHSVPSIKLAATTAAVWQKQSSLNQLFAVIETQKGSHSIADLMMSATSAVWISSLVKESQNSSRVSLPQRGPPTLPTFGSPLRWTARTWTQKSRKMQWPCNFAWNFRRPSSATELLLMKRLKTWCETTVVRRKQMKGRMKWRMKRTLRKAPMHHFHSLQIFKYASFAHVRAYLNRDSISIHPLAFIVQSLLLMTAYLWTLRKSTYAYYLFIKNDFIVQREIWTSAAGGSLLFQYFLKAHRYPTGRVRDGDGDAEQWQFWNWWFDVLYVFTEMWKNHCFQSLWRQSECTYFIKNRDVIKKS